MRLNWFSVLTALLLASGAIESANIVIIPMFSKSQLLSASRFAEILAEDGHHPVVVIPANDVPDIESSPKFDILTYETDMRRDDELAAGKQALAFSKKNILSGKVPATKQEILASRCRGFLLNDQFLAKFGALKPDVAIVHSLMGCVSAHLSRIGVPYLDFCSLPLIPALCGAPHGVPANPSYVPDMFFSDDEMGFVDRVLNTIFGIFATKFIAGFAYRLSDAVVADYQARHNLSREEILTLRSKASFLLVHGDLTFETIRPLMPKVVFLGGVQCDAPKPLSRDLQAFVDGSGETGIIVFSLGGALDTDALPHDYIENFFDIFRDLPQRVVWKLKQVPAPLVAKQPPNVKIVDWMPQQDLLGHPRTKLFISHGGIQGSFESICHGKPVLGIGMFSDQDTNLQILFRKGMALLVDDYKNLQSGVIRYQILELLNNPIYAKAALRAQLLFQDRPQSPAQRLQHAIGYTLRHGGARHLSSKAAMQLYWFQYYLLDVALFAGFIVVMVFCLVCLCLKKCCCGLSKKAKKE